MGGRVVRVLADEQLFMRAFPKSPRCTSAAHQRNDRPHFITHILNGHVIKLKLNKTRTAPRLIRNSPK